jgi:hypothetical protein
MLRRYAAYGTVRYATTLRALQAYATQRYDTTQLHYATLLRYDATLQRYATTLRYATLRRYATTLRYDATLRRYQILLKLLHSSLDFQPGFLTRISDPVNFYVQTFYRLHLLRLWTPTIYNVHIQHSWRQQVNIFEHSIVSPSASSCMKLMYTSVHGGLYL